MTNTLSNIESLEFLARELKAARLAKNLSIEDVSQLTKIKKDYLEQLEEGNFSFLPNSYVYACTKAYMKEMGLNGSEALGICKKDLQIHGALNKEAIVETGSRYNEMIDWINIIIHDSHLVRVILPLPIGIFIGILIGIGFSHSYKEHKAEIPVITTRTSIRPVDTSAINKQRSKHFISSSVQMKHSPAPINNPVSVVAPARRSASDTHE